MSRMPAPVRAWLDTGRRRWLGAAAGGVAVAVALAWLLWPVPAPYRPDPRDRQFSSYTVCALVGAGGITGAEAAPVWAGVTDAAKSTAVRGSFLPVPVGSAVQYLNTFVARRCGLIVAVGRDQVAAVDSRAAAYPAPSFVVVGGAASRPNVTAVGSGSPAEVRAAVTTAIRKAAAAIRSPK